MTIRVTIFICYVEIEITPQKCHKTFNPASLDKTVQGTDMDIRPAMVHLTTQGERIRLTM